MSLKTLTLEELYEQGVSVLAEAGVLEAGIDSWLLLSYVTGIDRTFYYMNMGMKVSDLHCDKFRESIKLRAMRVPLQHITNEQEFMGLAFRVNEHVLIPRQDTETLVEAGNGLLGQEMKILDLCTGSGCILISLGVEARKRNLEHVRLTGTDISQEALAIAKENAARHYVDAKWIESDLFQNIEEKFDLIISNPPYIKTEVIKSLDEEVRCHDPFIALDGREDGLHFYKRIIKEVGSYLNHNGRLLFEIGHDQKEEVCSLMEQAGFADVTCQKDMAGLDRIVLGMYNKAE